jgi:hypothetical protein
LEDLNGDKRIALNAFKVNTNEDVGWIYLAQGRAHWQALVNEIMNFRVP